MKKFLAVLVLICIASAQTPCAWDYLNTVATDLLGTNSSINICGCYQDGRALVETIISIVEGNYSNGYAGIVNDTTNITELVGQVLSECGITNEFVNILPDVCIADLQTVAFYGESAITELISSNFSQFGLDMPTLYCAIANATTTCPFLYDYPLPYAYACECVDSSEQIFTASFALALSIEFKNEQQIQSDAVNLVSSIPAFLSDCHIADVNFINAQCIESIYPLYENLVQLVEDLSSGARMSAVFDLPETYCLFSEFAYACPFMEKVAAYIIPASCQCVGAAEGIFAQVQKLYDQSTPITSIEIQENALQLVSMIPSLVANCDSNFEYLGGQCIDSFVTIYETVVGDIPDVKAENWEKIGFVDLPQLFCLYEDVVSNCPFMSNFFTLSIPISCQCFENGVQIYQNLKQLYSSYESGFTFGTVESNLWNLIEILPGILIDCNIDIPLFGAACTEDLTIIYQYAMNLWNDRHNLVDVVIEIPDFLCSLQSATQNCPFLSDLLK